jgi:hypothetical protein
MIEERLFSGLREVNAHAAPELIVVLDIVQVVAGAGGGATAGERE